MFRFILSTLLSVVLVFHVQAQNAESHPREQEAISFVTDWLNLIEDQNVSDSYTMVSDQFIGSEAQWHESVTSDVESLGSLISRKFIRSVAYIDPPNAPQKGLYVAIEFNSVYKQARKHFQYIIVHSENGEPFKINNRQVNVLALPAE